jgi:hypothetical protein
MSQVNFETDRCQRVANKESILRPTLFQNISVYQVACIRVLTSIW